MFNGTDRLCDVCGQRLPKNAKLASQIVSEEEATAVAAALIQMGGSLPPSGEGGVSLDMCLNCRIQYAQRKLHPEHLA